MMRYVEDKFCGRHWPLESRAVLDASSIAVLSAQLHLDLSPAAPEAKEYEVELVRNHLWMLYSVQYQDVMVTGSSGHVGVIRGLRRPWLGMQGTIGQLIGRALSISVMDRAIDALSNICELTYQTPITVPSYYKALLTDEAWEILRLSTPLNYAWLSKNSATTTFEDAFADAYFHFSHYGKAINSTPMHDT